MRHSRQPARLLENTGRKMNCSNCGTPIPPDERFCRNCGHEAVPLAQTIIAREPPPSLPNRQPNVTQQFDPYGETAREWPTPPTAGQFPSLAAPPAPGAAQPTGRSPLLIPLAIASIVLAIAAIGVLVYFVSSRSSEDERAARTGDPTPRPTASPNASVSTATPSPTTTPSPSVTPSPTPTPTPTPKPTPNNEPPAGARLGYCNDTNVFVRNAPNLNARPVTKITRGQKLWVIGTSSNYSTWNGINSNWTQVQLYNSSLRGWVFSPFVSFQ